MTSRSNRRNHRLHAASAATLLALCALTVGCDSTGGRLALTPLTGIRDIVDAPLVTLTNAFETWAESSSKTPTPQAGVGVGTGGLGAGIGLNFSYYLFKPLSWILGGVDYVVCRSFWPEWPKGISPWKGPDEGWGSLYFPSSRALWRSDEPVEETDGKVEDGSAEAR